MDVAFDFQMPLLVVSLAGAAAVIIYLISVFGIREKTFEEAIASQKEISQELLGKKELKKKAVKRKVKPKKEDKPPKEKDLEKEKESHAHPHVEICPQPIIMDDNTGRRPSLAALGGRRESIKSILVNKSEISPVGEGDFVVESNHFENRHPKDDFELKKQVSTEDELPASEDNENEVEEEIIEACESVQVGSQLGSSVVSTDSLTNSNLRKPSKKSKKAQVITQTSELNATKLVSVIDKVTLSSDEIQNLIEYLLNRQLDAGVATEWVNKSKSDTTASLKKALAERDLQLAEEQATVDTLQQKLKELRSEFSVEKNRLTGLKKALEDRNTTLQQESQQFQLRVQQLNGLIGEKQNLERQMQEFQRRSSVLQDENMNLKKVLSADQSFRMKAENLEREAEALRTQCSHLEAQLKSSFQSNSDLAAQVRGLQEHSRGLEMKVVDFEHLQGFSAQLQERETHLINELKHAEAKVLESDAEKNMFREKLRDSEAEIRVNREEAERKVEESHQSEKNAKNLLQDTKSSLAQIENQLKAKEVELKKIQDEKNSSSEELRVRIKSLEDAELALEKRLGLSEGSAAILKAEKESLTEKISKQKQEIVALNQKNDEMKDENSKLAETFRLRESCFEDQVKAAEVHAEEVEIKAKQNVLHSIQEQIETLSGIAVQKDSEAWLLDFVEEFKNQSTPPPPPSEDNSSQIERLQGEVEHYQRTLKNTEAILSNLEHSIADSEKNWETKLQSKHAELDAALQAATSQANSATAHLEAELNLQRETNTKLVELNRDLEEKLSNSNNSHIKEDNVSIASIEELKVENQELRAEVQRLIQAPHSPEVANGNGTSPKLITSSAVSVDSKGTENRSGETDALSPTGETKKKKKVLSGLFGSKK